MEISLVIMAAGIGSRFGGGIKQLESVGPNGEIIMDYSVHDAIEAGFNKIVFVIRKDIEKDFREVIGNRVENACHRKGVQVAYAFQALDAVPDGITVPENRVKPWGTGQAVLACKECLQEPFAVINADDYYGKEAFVKVHDFLISYSPESPMSLCMAGFILKNTLSDNGEVTRGICSIDEEHNLTRIMETSHIIKTADGGAVADGEYIDVNVPVSMNMWGFTPEFLDQLERGFVEFLANIGENQLIAEYLLPIYIGDLLKDEKVSVKVLETADQWLGVTYKEDTIAVAEAFASMVHAGVYSSPL